MPLEIDQNSAKYQIQAYKPGIIVVNGKMIKTSIIISASELIENWSPKTAAELTPETLSTVITLKPDVLLIGTGGQHILLPIEVYGDLINQQIGVEIMDTSAACRTFNALSAEGRNVVAALVI